MAAPRVLFELDQTKEWWIRGVEYRKPIIEMFIKKTVPIAVKSFIYQWIKNTVRNGRVSFATLASRKEREYYEMMVRLTQELKIGPPDFTSFQVSMWDTVRRQYSRCLISSKRLDREYEEMMVKTQKMIRDKIIMRAQKEIEVNAGRDGTRCITSDDELHQTPLMVPCHPYFGGCESHSYRRKALFDHRPHPLPWSLAVSWNVLFRTHNISCLDWAHSNGLTWSLLLLQLPRSTLFSSVSAILSFEAG